jgi:hypothetical protein
MFPLFFSSLEDATMNAAEICAEIDRLFGNLELDTCDAYAAMAQVARHAGQYAELLEGVEV